MNESRRLLAEYAERGSEAAFRELVERYIRLVYTTALRLVGGDTHRAQDIAQTVFIGLARQARNFSAGVMLGGWLHRHTCKRSRESHAPRAASSTARTASNGIEPPE